MRDPYDRHAKFLAQTHDEVDDLCLRCDIKRCCGLVRDEEQRIAGQGHGYHDALPHAA